MTTPTVIVGVDPGGTTGISSVRYWAGASRYHYIGRQIRSTEDPHNWLRKIIEAYHAEGQLLAVAVEEFVVSTRASQSGHAIGGQLARDLVAEASSLARECGVRCVVAPAGGVKPWASNKRLMVAGMYVPGQQHARDAARHALYAGVKNFGWPDPLSIAYLRAREAKTRA